jgi:outer membrane protein assembly factor BamB
MQRITLAWIACLLLCSSLDRTTAQEWTRFRGPNGSGVSDAKTVPASWTESDYNWRLDLPGEGHSSPVLWGERLFLTSAEAGQRWVLCIDAAAGKELWRKGYPFAAYKKHNMNSFATSTPAVDAERVYVLWQSREASALAALDHAGNELWSFDVGPFKGGHGGGVSPIVYDGMVIVGNDQEGPSSLIAVDAATGKLRWQAERRSTRATYATPCVYQTGDRPAELIFTDWEHGITAIDPATGEQKWELSVFGSEVERAIGSPLVAGDLVIGTCGFVTSKKHLVAVRPQDAPDGVKVEEVYRFEKGAPHLPTPIVVGDLLFAITEQGIATCLDVKTGEQVWQQRIGGNFAGSPVCAGGKLYAVDDNGTVVVLAASREYQELARNELGQLSRSTPAIAGGRLYLRTVSRLFSIGGE